MGRTKRILAVTAGLVVAGAVIGAVLGVLVLALTAVILGGWSSLRFDGLLLPMGLVFGAMRGAVLAPAAAWLLMRDVPLGRAIGGTALGTVLGAVMGTVLAPGTTFLMALAGFVAAAVYLRVRSGRSRRVS